MKIKTALLQNMVSKAIKGASNNKMIPITSLIGIEIDNNQLILTTSDGSNQLKVIEKLEEASANFYTIVNAETFSKLVSKTTKEYIELINKENYLEVKGNGSYKLEIPTNEDGDIIKFPDYMVSEDNKIELAIAKLKGILNKAKQSVAKSMEVPVLTGYYISDKAIATDREMVCYIKDNILENPILISSELAELLQLLEGENVSLNIDSNKLLFTTPNIVIYSKQLEGIEMYPVTPIENLVKLAYENISKVNKQDLLNVLDRMSLFVSDYDKNGVYLTFTENSLQITSQKSNAIEILNTEDEGSLKDFNCLVDIEMLKSQIQSTLGEIIEIHYGQQKSIKLVEDNTILIISLMDENN